MEEQAAVQVHQEVDAPKKNSQLLDKLFTWVLVAMAALIPVAFFWRTFEYFESAKNMILIFGAFALTGLWILKAAKKKEFKIKKTPFNLPILLWLLASLLSLVFSDVMSTSFLGYFSRLTGSFAQTLALVLMYFAVVNNVDSKRTFKMILSSFLVSSSLMLLYGVLRYFGVFQTQIESLSTDHPTLLFLRTNSANPLANANAAPALSLVVMVLSLGWMLRDMDMVKKVAGMLMVVVSGFYLGITAFISVDYQGVALLVLAVAGVGLTLYHNRKVLAGNNLYMLLVSGVLIVAFGLLVNVASLRTSFGINQEFSKPPLLRPDFSWTVTTAGIADKKDGLLPKGFFFGRGQDTYPFSFTKYKPLEINQTDLWNIKFSLPSMEVERVIHDTGILGFAAFAFLVVALVRTIIALKKDKEFMSDPMVVSMLLGLGLLLLMHVTIFFSAAMIFLFWLLLSYAGVVVSKDETKYFVILGGAGEKKDMGNTMAFVLALIAVLVIGGISFVLVRNFYAETLFRRGYNAHFITGDYEMAVSDQKAALKYSDREYIHRMLALSSLNRGIDLLKEKNPNAETTLKSAVEEIAAAKERNAYYVETVEAEVSIYSIMVNLTRGKEYGAELLDAVNRGVALDPRNPDKLINLGIINNAVGNKELAESQLITAYSYRQDYWKSIVALAEFWAVNGKKTDAVDLLASKLSLYAEGTSEYKAIKDAQARVEESKVAPKETPETNDQTKEGGDVTNQ